MTPDRSRPADGRAAHETGRGVDSARIAAIDRRLGVVALLGIAAVAIALVSQHRYGMEPCPWCVLQRVMFLAIAVAAILGLVWRSAPGRIAASALIVVLADLGVVAALWQHFVAARSASCSLTVADRIVNALGLAKLAPDVFEARASCADAAASLFGVSYDFWSLVLFAVLSLMALTVLLRALRR